MVRLLLSLYILATIFFSPSASAWNNFGHMEVASIAWEHLTPVARARAGELLKLNPMYEAWTENVAPQNQARIAFIRASSWADTIKGDPDYTNDGAAGGNRPPRGPEASWNIGYKDHLRHKYWHFTNIPFSPDGTPLEDPAKPNIQTQIARFRAALAAEDTAEDIKSYDLVWLIHLVGDAHQPLHSTSRFTRTHPHGDEGGNLVKIHCGSGCSARNLHEFWDDVLGQSTPGVETVIETAKNLPPPPGIGRCNTDEKVWLQEAFEIAKTEVYREPISEGPGPFVLDEGYKATALEVAKGRVGLAGVRLAALLNAAFR
jgi:S1/P1 Nuclease